MKIVDQKIEGIPFGVILEVLELLHRKGVIVGIPDVVKGGYSEPTVDSLLEILQGPDWSTRMPKAQS